MFYHELKKADNIVRQLGLSHFREAINFLVNPYYQVPAYLMIQDNLISACKIQCPYKQIILLF